MAWCVFIVMAVILSVRDWKIQKISHNSMFVGLVFLAMCYFLLFVNTVLGIGGYMTTWYKVNFYKSLLIHLSFMMLAAISLWMIRIWPAGDAKLFFLLGAVIPLMPNEPNFENGRLFFTLLINIFLPAFVYVFVGAIRHFWSTRIKHTIAFMKEAGLIRIWEIAWAQITTYSPFARRKIFISIRFICRYPSTIFKYAINFGITFVAMCGFSAAAHSLVSSPGLRSAISCAIIILLNTTGKSIANWVIRASALIVIIAVIIMPEASEFRIELIHSAASLTIFGLFIQFGAIWAVGIVGGGIFSFLMPFAGIFISLIFIIKNYITSLLSGIPFSFNINRSPLLSIGILGCCFGIGAVFVYIWENEDVPQIPTNRLKSYMLPHRSFLDLLQLNDPDFTERHLDSLYADGLTVRQAMAVRGWAQRHDYDTIPIQTTMPFAFWIFFWLYDYARSTPESY